MSTKDGNDASENSARFERPKLETADAQEVRNASGQTMSTVESLRTNVSDGSLRDRAKPDVEHGDSIQISGAAGIASSRANRLTESELSAQNLATKSIDIRELLAKPEKEAQVLVEEFGRVMNMPVGAARDADLFKVQQIADKTYARGRYADIDLTKSPQIFEQPAPAGNLLSRDAGHRRQVDTIKLELLAQDLNISEAKREFANTVREMRIQSKALGTPTDAIDEYARQILAPELAAQKQPERSDGNKDSHESRSEERILLADSRDHLQRPHIQARIPALGDHIAATARELGEQQPKRWQNDEKHNIYTCNKFLDASLRKAGANLPWDKAHIPTVHNMRALLTHASDFKLAYSSESEFEHYQPTAGDIVMWDFIPHHYPTEPAHRLQHCGIIDDQGTLLYGGSTRSGAYDETPLKTLNSIYGPPTTIYRYSPQLR